MNIGGVLADCIHEDFFDKTHHRGVDLGILGLRLCRAFLPHVGKTVILRQISQF